MADSGSLDAEHFAERFTASGLTGPRAVEKEALGSDYGATGYTTRDQADELGSLLGLDETSVLLDVGAGCGWPGLYLATRLGCRVLSTDPTEEGPRTAHDRIRRDGLGSRALALVASGGQLPVRPASVDAVTHTDVLC